MSKLVLFVPRIPRGEGEVIRKLTGALVVTNEDALLGRWSCGLVADKKVQSPLDVLRTLCESDESDCIVTDVRAIFNDRRLAHMNMVGSTYHGWQVLSMLPTDWVSWCVKLFGAHQFTRDIDTSYIADARTSYEDILRIHGVNPGLGAVVRGDFERADYVYAVTHRHTILNEPTLWTPRSIPETTN